VADPFLPSVLVYRDVESAATSAVPPLNATIVGPHAQLVRHGVAAEKATGLLGAYQPAVDTTYAWPGLVVGGLVDLGYAKLFADSARAAFYTHPVGGGSITIAAVSNKPTQLQVSGSAGWRLNGSHARLAALYGRDVQPGDRVRVVGTVSSTTYTLDTYVASLTGPDDAATTGTATADSANAGTQSAASAATQTGGVTNCISVTVDATDYNGLVDGVINETYTVSVVQNSTGGNFATGLIRVRSASGLDDVASMAPAAGGTAFTVGHRGLKLTFVITSGPCNLTVGQTWQVTVAQAFAATTGTAAGTYTGTASDTYILTVTRGGLLAETDPTKTPQWTISTAKGLDSSGPFTPTAVSTAYAIGTQGLTFSLGGSIVALRKGDRFTIAVTPAQLGNVNTLVLANPLPVALRTATDVNLWLYTQKDVEVPLNRAGYDPITNYSVDASNGITVRSGIVLYDPAFVDNSGAQIPLTLIDGTMYVQYRAWLPDLSGQVRSVATTSDLATVSGAIDPDNPIVWALSKALLGAAGVPITYIGVSDPSDSTSWAKAIARLDGRDDVYDIVPLTYDPAIINLFVAHADSQSSPESAHERRVVIGLVPSLSEMLVGQATSTDGGVVLATLGDDPNTSGTQYTLFTIPADNGKVITRGVLPGDTVRYAYTTSFGQPVYSTYTVASVISEYSFTVVGGAAAAVTTPQRLEIWHANSIDEIVTDLVDQATAYADQRVIAVWSDLIGLTARSTETYYIAAALAGYMAGVWPHQGLTNAAVAGFADVVSGTGLLNQTQCGTLAANGVWLVSRTPSVQSNAVINRLATSTDNSTLAAREEMVLRNMDSMVKFLRTRLNRYLQGTNVTPSAEILLGVEVTAAHNYLKASGYSDRLGGQLIEGVLNGISPHTVFHDRLVVDADWTIPCPVNTIEVHINAVLS
jgi:hypothetical protein